jgi:hypothetical protein
MELQNLFYLLGGAGVAASIVLALVYGRRNRFWLTLFIVSITLLLVGFFFIQSSLRNKELEDVAKNPSEGGRRSIGQVRLKPLPADQPRLAHHESPASG